MPKPPINQCTTRPIQWQWQSINGNGSNYSCQGVPRANGGKVAGQCDDERTSRVKANQWQINASPAPSPPPSLLTLSASWRMVVMVGWPWDGWPQWPVVALLVLMSSGGFFIFYERRGEKIVMLGFVWGAPLFVSWVSTLTISRQILKEDACPP